MKYIKLRTIILIFTFLTASLTAILPVVSYAQTPKNLGEFFGILSDLILGSIIPLLFVAGVLVFIWGVLKYMTSAGDQTKKAEGVQFIIWGIAGLFVMLSIMAILGIVAGTFDIKLELPKLPQ